MLTGFQRYSQADRGPLSLPLSVPVDIWLPLELRTIRHRTFATGWQGWDGLLRTRNDIRWYEQENPFTDLYYVQGLAGEQWFNATHTRKLGPHLRVSADYFIRNVNGFYANQRGNIENFHTYLHYTPDSSRYRLAIGYLSNDVDQQVNGGVDTTAYTDINDLFAQSRREFIPTRLDNPLLDFNRREGFMEQSYSLIQSHGDADSVGTTDHDLLRLVHRMSIERERFQYTDPRPTLEEYDHIWLRADTTRDRSQAVTFSNALGLLLMEPTDHAGDTTRFMPFVGEAYLRYNRHRWDQQGRFSYDHNLSIEGTLRSNPKSDTTWHWRIDGSYFFSGFNGGDYSLEAVSRWRLAGKLAVGGSLLVARQMPWLLHTRYLGNHRLWDHDWGKMSWQQVTGFAAWEPTQSRLELMSGLFTDWLYFGDDGLPAQWTGTQSLLRVTLSQPIHVGHFHLLTRFSWQRVPSEGPWRLPQWVMFHSLYYQGMWFYKATRVQLGVDIRYHSPYVPYGFDPVTAQLTTPNVRPMDTYPVLDVFLNMYVKRARLFAKMEHVNQGILFPPGQFTAPGYPLMDRSFRFGVSWRFYD